MSITLDFLKANVPLRKEFVQRDNAIEVIPYPMVRELTSHRTEANTIEEFHAAVIAHADMGFCLLKGLLDRPLIEESRTGHTHPEGPTNWICLDFDLEDGWADVDAMLHDIDPILAETDYIWTHSSSAGITKKAGLRGHAFFILDDPTTPGILKLWLRYLNFENATLKGQITLTASSMGLRWPLDVSTCQNDKLIYIADPGLTPLIHDPLTGRRIELRKRNRRTFEFGLDISPESIEEQTRTQVDELRAAAGLRRQKAKISVQGGQEILQNPGRSIVVGRKDCGDKWRLNLPDSNSWGYYIYKNDIELVRNYKDLPLMRTRDLLPDLYRELVEATRVQGKKYYVFRRFSDDTYYNVIYDPNTEQLRFGAASGKSKLKDFLEQYGQNLPEVIEDWEVSFDPTNPDRVDEAARWLNLFSPSDYMLDKRSPPPDVPRTIKRILMHVVGNDEEFYDYLINWLACLFKYRCKLGTAILLQGTQGTGKGYMYKNIIQPLLGHQYTNEKLMESFDDMYNAYLEYCLLLFIDEADMDDTANAKRAMSKLKNLITEKTHPIRGMRQNPVDRPNYTNVIFASNQFTPIEIPDNDRRISVAPRQEIQIVIHPHEDEIVEEELWYFAAYLRHYPADLKRARRPLENVARQEMIGMGHNTVQLFFEAIHEKDLTYFEDFLSDATSAQLNPNYMVFAKSVKQWRAEAEAFVASRVHRDDLRAVYNYMQGQGISPSKFSRLCRRYGTPVTPMSINGTVSRGLEILWNPKDENEKELRPDSPPASIDHAAA